MLIGSTFFSLFLMVSFDRVRGRVYWIFFRRKTKYIERFLHVNIAKTVNDIKILLHPEWNLWNFWRGISFLKSIKSYLYPFAQNLCAKTLYLVYPFKKYSAYSSSSSYSAYPIIFPCVYITINSRDICPLRDHAKNIIEK